jgi:sphingolipid 4-desaturase/C4-monooxygenase
VSNDKPPQLVSGWRVRFSTGLPTAGIILSSVPTADYFRATNSEPHGTRARHLLAAHPDLRALAGQTPTSALWTIGLVAVQCGLAVLIGDRTWMLWLPCAYVIGATIDHALWVLIHECSHHLVFRSRVANRMLAIVANVPLVVPGAMSFFKYHLLHHRHLGELDLDAGVPGPTESRIVGRSVFAKALWISGFIFVTGAIRPRRLKIKVLDRWTVINAIVQTGALVALIGAAGLAPLKYLIVSTVFAIGFHPLGGRWIQEHFALAPDQETYSYYGPLNRVSFNAGYHNEHHDLVTVPWSRLPEVRRIAPEFYKGLHSYNSWSGLLVRFVFDRNISLFSYIVRAPRQEHTAARRA